VADPSASSGAGADADLLDGGSSGEPVDRVEAELGVPLHLLQRRQTNERVSELPVFGRKWRHTGKFNVL
jgi:hypothetical protein